MSVRIRDKWYFPMQFRLAAPVAAVLGAGLLITKPLVGVLLLVGGAAVVSTHYGFRIDRQARRYVEYVWILGWRYGQLVPYDRIEYLFINPARVSRTYNLRVNSSTITETEYNGYLKLTGDVKIHVAGSTDKALVLKKMLKLKDYLGIALHDHSVRQPTDT